MNRDVFFVGVAVAMMGLLPLQAVAAQQTYVCDYKIHGRTYGLLSERAIYQIDATKQTATAMDGMIAAKQNKPMKVEFRQATTQRVRLKWTVQGVNMTYTNGAAKAIGVNYTININTKTKKSTVKARLDRDVTNNLTASGTCALQK